MQGSTVCIVMAIIAVLQCSHALQVNRWLTSTKKLTILSLFPRKQQSVFDHEQSLIPKNLVKESCEQQTTNNTNKSKKWNWKSVAMAIMMSCSLTGTSLLFSSPAPAIAADTVAVGKCLLQSCQLELAKCVLNPKCLANVICLNTCNTAKDESACQIRCGDLFENDVVGEFNACAVSQKRCVPQKQDEGAYPIPAPESQVKSFDTSIWNGRWYISAGLNKIFDIFDCQVHFFTSPSPGLFYAKLFWRITEPDGEFFTKNAIQRFKQDPKNPAHLINHDNEYLHYKDDWYILDYEPNDFVLVYYKGSNDAWDGYGGAFLYTRAPSVRPELIPRLEKAVERAKVPYKWKDFVLTDNTCKKQTENPTVLREEFAKRLLITSEQQLQEQLTATRNAAINTIVQEEKEAEVSINFLEKELEKFIQEAEVAVENEVETLLPNILPGAESTKATQAK